MQLKLFKVVMYLKYVFQIDSSNALGRPQDLSGLESLGSSLLCSSAGAKETNEQLGALLDATGNTQIEISKAEKVYLEKAKISVIEPFKTFLENDAKTIFKEKGILETKRLDLDAAKAKLKKVKTLEGRDQQEKEVRSLQVRVSLSLLQLTVYQDRFRKTAGTT